MPRSLFVAYGPESKKWSGHPNLIKEFICSSVGVKHFVDGKATVAPNANATHANTNFLSDPYPIVNQQIKLWN
jgi:hypothetical protein